MRVWQVHAVLSLVPFIEACDRLPDHTTTSTIPLAAFDCIIHNVLLLSVRFGQQTASTKRQCRKRVLTPADCPLLFLDPGPQQDHCNRVTVRVLAFFMVSYDVYLYVIRFISQIRSDAGRCFLVLTPPPHEGPGGEPCTRDIFGPMLLYTMYQ